MFHSCQVLFNRCLKVTLIFQNDNEPFNRIREYHTVAFIKSFVIPDTFLEIVIKCVAIFFTTGETLAGILHPEGIKIIFEDTTGKIPGLMSGLCSYPGRKFFIKTCIQKEIIDNLAVFIYSVHLFAEVPTFQ